MPDGSNVAAIEQTKPELIAEERANRLHALVVALNEMRPETTLVCMTAGERANVLGNILAMALEESRQLLKVGGAGGFNG